MTKNPILYAPVDNSQGFWSFASTTFTLNGTSHTLDGGSAIADTGRPGLPSLSPSTHTFDTGTTLMLLPDSAVEQIYGAIPGSKLDSTQGGYVYPANATIPALTFAVGDNFFTSTRRTSGTATPRTASSSVASRAAAPSAFRSLATSS